MASLANHLSLTRSLGEDSPVVFDRERLRTLTDGDAEFEQELIETYKDSAHSILVQLRAHLVDGDAGGIGRQAHALKGASVNIGADAISRCAAEIESAARAGDVGAAREMLDELVAAERALWQELEGR